MDWELTIEFHFPHDRFMIGWEVIQPTEEFNYRTISIYLFFITITLDF